MHTHGVLLWKLISVATIDIIMHASLCKKYVSLTASMGLHDFLSHDDRVPTVWKISQDGV